MAKKVDERIPEELFADKMIEKANIIKECLRSMKRYMSVDHSGQYRTHYGRIQILRYDRRR